MSTLGSCVLVGSCKLEIGENTATIVVAQGACTRSDSPASALACLLDAGNVEHQKSDKLLKNDH